MPIPATEHAASSPSTPVSRPGAVNPLFLLGALCLVVALFAAAWMSISHIGGIALPGCGKGSPCAAVSSGKWGNLPLGGFLWPVSYLGVAYFAGMLGAWVVGRGTIGPALRWLAIAGALASAVFLGIMLGQNAVCPYCVTTHLANFGFVAVLGLSAAPAAAARLRPSMGVAMLAGIFAVCSVALGVGDATFRKGVKAREQAELDSSLAEIRNTFAQPKPETTPAPVPPPSQPTTAQTNPPAPPSPQPQQAATPQPPAPQPPIPAPQVTPPAPPAPAVAAAQPAGFTGRYRFGPEQAGVRVVLFTDYQCPDCKRIEGQLEEVLGKYPNVSIAVKHFPFCTECNPNVPNLHPNACWAARAAETAGILGGTTAYHKMHQWLFARGGVFTTQAQLDEGIAQAGLDQQRFMQVLQSDLPMKNIQADIQEAMALGIGSTPFIFINGKELKGWNAKPTAVGEAVSALAAADPPAAGPERDLPPRAFAKFIADWKEQIQMAWPSRPKPYALGGPMAPVKVTVFGDLQERYTAEADKAIRDYIGNRPDVRYEFRYFPVDPTCNPGVPQIPGAAGCRAAKAAEAAGQLGGDAAYWKFHNWITQNQSRFSDDAVRGLAKEINLDPEAVIAKMNSPEVESAITGDISIGKRLGVPSIPRIFINGKLVPRWQLPGGGVLETIIEEAATLKPPPPATPVTVDPVMNNPIIKQLQNR